jgi:hypothetical protein
MVKTLADELAQMSDRELVEVQGCIGDPDYRRMVLAEERRRTSEKAVITAKKANWIALGALIVSLASLIISTFIALR